MTSQIRPGIAGVEAEPAIIRGDVSLGKLELGEYEAVISARVWARRLRGRVSRLVSPSQLRFPSLRCTRCHFVPGSSSKSGRDLEFRYNELRRVGSTVAFHVGEY